MHSSKRQKVNETGGENATEQRSNTREQQQNNEEDKNNTQATTSTRRRDIKDGKLKHNFSTKNNF